MKVLQATPEEAITGLRVQLAVLTADRPLSDGGKKFLNALQKHVLHINADISSLTPITPDEAAASVSREAIRERTIQAAVISAMTDTDTSPARDALIQSFTKAFQIQTPAVKVYSDLANKRMFQFRIDFMRRSHIRRLLEDHKEKHGTLSTLVAAGRMTGLIKHTDDALAAKYQALEHYHPDTLGHHYWHFITSQGFAFSGQRFGFPEENNYHDLTHVLSGYDTTPEGETQVAAVQAGYTRENPMFILMFVLAQFSAGVRIAPSANVLAHTDTISHGNLSELFFKAMERGEQVNTDLSDHWDYWPYLKMPLEEARAALGIPPLV